ncbi:MAG: ribosomal RNA small subunit methyltransferase A [Bacteroidetes bacterium]|nr:MAG: ribosomal RNA small subunit methyltransferase A [Bacteroidota bacterium]
MHNLKPKKQLGQHFLRDTQAARRIVDALKAPEGAFVAEIGPGEGVLTGFLLEKYSALTAIEIDTEAVQLLNQRFAGTSLRIVHTDVLTWDPAGEGDHLYLIGNLPYNISSPFFFLMLENRSRIEEGVFMIQKEVAERICAPPGSKTYGILSVLLQAFFEVKYVFSVPPGAFRPPPKVMSGVIRLVKRAEVPDISFADFKKVVKTAFQQRRKTLRNALSGLDFEENPQLEALWPQRAEQLGVAEFLLLTRCLK